MKKLKNGEEFMVGEKTYRVVDEELFEVKLEKVSKDEYPWIPVPYYPLPVYPSYPDWTGPTWISNSTVSSGEIRFFPDSSYSKE